MQWAATRFSPPACNFLSLRDTHGGVLADSVTHRPPENLSLDAGPADSPALRLTSGDPLAFDQVVAMYQDRVTRLAWRLLGWQRDVDDVVQDVFLVVLRSADAFRGDSRLWTWIAGITVNACRNRRRSWLRFFRWSARYAASAPTTPTRDASPHAPDDAAIDAEDRQRIHDAIRALPAAHREVIVLRYLEEMSSDAVADVLATTRNSVEVRLSRAREKLRVLLGADFGKRYG